MLFNVIEKVRDLKKTTASIKALVFTSIEKINVWFEIFSCIDVNEMTEMAEKSGLLLYVRTIGNVPPYQKMHLE